ncbi:pyruvate, water dikinase [Acidianus sulfidivorans JP7]|uniref:pyruvate, water dikinase n=1 Tax=Acidianus sulfidivorans JP7 TaxID=619593 RepID=A0A2U9ILM9_9CREN|nr:PEP/pyruvate-binding domain-containing protein [Acidianus sulfidivorans]AWR96913.1 pyruvate, water dikinase [Acidianus sulfidivorans JP7]
MRIYKLNQVSLNMINEVGRKSAYLGEIMQSGIKVPNGLIIPQSEFRSYLEYVKPEIDKILSKSNLKDLESIKNTYDEIKDVFLSLPLDKELQEELNKEISTLKTEYFAVRPTVTSSLNGPSFAGELDTYLFVPKDEISTFVRLSWASYFNPRSMAYRILYGENIPIAILIQEMVNPISAGTVFTLHPVEFDTQKVLIESAWGLGEAVTRGIITPDEFILTKTERMVKEKKISKKDVKLIYDFSSKSIRQVQLDDHEALKPSISDREAVKIANLALKIEDMLKRPVNIEWAISNNEIYILEVRGIRASYEII